MVGRRPYQIVIGSPKGQDDSANVKRFFNSFKVSPINSDFLVNFENIRLTFCKTSPVYSNNRGDNHRGHRSFLFEPAKPASPPAAFELDELTITDLQQGPAIR